MPLKKESAFDKFVRLYQEAIDEGITLEQMATRVNLTPQGLKDRRSYFETRYGVTFYKLKGE